MKRLLGALLTIAMLSVGHISIAKDLPEYNRIQGLSGNLTSTGSDTLASIMSRWSEEFQEIYPNVVMQVQASGSSTAGPALAEGTAQLGPMSRLMRLKEIEAFEREHGYKPTALRVAIDAIGIFVHEDNPVKGLNFEQIDAIFSITLNCGGHFPIETWQQLGLDDSWAKRRFQLFGRNSVSGTYGFFKQTALCGGDFKQYVNELPGSASVVQSVASSINTIGYSGIGYQVSGAKYLPIARYGSDYIEATPENISADKYPLSRYLYVYVNKHPTKRLSPIEREFIRFIYSKQGQEMVQKDGYVPVSQEIADKELQKVGL
ncbi:phosphate ABC transporter substrate-binding protein PstS family protein [Vibrio sp. JC009]|uniref:PstS family phosphate ABC transporter substrate-binding protein n=1 Tax=Vibrio sp. JC009 TaxID=2912314 RepID=UPI0023AFC2D5|nr:phosphate ABC transporter substrate-binding protein PstS family protein [Vibrio sp. JC009]WED22320.1 phosphate ABC transporter substrate-binding protein PstS family protein [Vibrio sp. JC009]